MTKIHQVIKVGDVKNGYDIYPKLSHNQTGTESVYMKILEHQADITKNYLSGAIYAMANKLGTMIIVNKVTNDRFQHIDALLFRRIVFAGTLAFHNMNRPSIITIDTTTFPISNNDIMSIIYKNNLYYQLYIKTIVIAHDMHKNTKDITHVYPITEEDMIFIGEFHTRNTDIMDEMNKRRVREQKVRKIYNNASYNTVIDI